MRAGRPCHAFGLLAVRQAKQFFSASCPCSRAFLLLLGIQSSCSWFFVLAKAIENERAFYALHALLQE
jgi:hypothetical protein